VYTLIRFKLSLSPPKITQNFYVDNTYQAALRSNKEQSKRKGGEEGNSELRSGIMMG